MAGGVIGRSSNPRMVTGRPMAGGVIGRGGFTYPGKQPEYDPYGRRIPPTTLPPAAGSPEYDEYLRKQRQAGIESEAAGRWAGGKDQRDYESRQHQQDLARDDLNFQRQRQLASEGFNRADTRVREGRQYQEGLLDRYGRDLGDSPSQPLPAWNEPAATTTSVPTAVAPLSGGPTRVADQLAPDAAEMERGVFARGKERVGQNTEAALKSLNAAMSTRGLSGSGLQARGTAEVIGRGGSDVANLLTNQAIEGFRRASDVSNRNYAGNLQQREQDIGVRGQNLGARGQDIGVQEAAAGRTFAGGQNAAARALGARGQDIGVQEAAAGRTFAGGQNAAARALAARGQGLAYTQRERDRQQAAKLARLRAATGGLQAAY